MAVSKVILNGTTLIDTTDKTVTAGGMLSGVTALKNDGTSITGNIATKTSSDLTASGATVTAPAGYYASSASKSVSSGSATTPATSITANPSISVSSGGLITASVSASQNVTPTVSAGYVSSGTAGTVSVSGSNTSQLTAQAAQTIHPSTSDQTIASGKYLTGAQTVKGVLLTNLSASNIKKDVVVKVGDSTDDDCVASVTGTFEGGGGGSSYTLIATDDFTVTTSSTSVTTVGTLTYSAGSSYDMRDKVICVTAFDKQGLRNGYCYGSTFYFTCASANNTGSVGGGICYRCDNNRVAQTSNKYGVYCSDIVSSSTNNITITISARYSSTYSQTIDGTFEVNAYLLDWPTGTSPLK